MRLVLSHGNLEHCRLMCLCGDPPAIADYTVLEDRWIESSTLEMYGDPVEKRTWGPGSKLGRGFDLTSNAQPR